MRIGINALFNPTGGSLTNLRILLAEWSCKQQGDIFLYVKKRTWEKLGDLDLRGISLRFAPPRLSYLGSRLGLEQFWLPVSGARDKLDVLFCPANTTPVLFNAPIVVTFQNIAPFEPGIPWREMGFRRTLRFQILRSLMHLSAWRARKIIFGSQFFRELYCCRTGFPRCKTAVIPRSIPQPRRRSKRTQHKIVLADGRQLETPYLLCVSHLHPYKKILELIRGFAKAKESQHLEKVKLVIAGKGYLSSRYADSVYHLITEFGLRDEIIMTGELEHDEINNFYAGADGFIFTSVCENCPTALVEAIAHGLPILCSNKSSMPEVAGDVAVYFDPTDSTEVAKAIRILYEDNLFEKLSGRSQQRARDMPSAEEMATRTYKLLFDEVVATKKLS